MLRTLCRPKAVSSVLALLLAVTAVMSANPGAASAHERRAVGKYTFVVGWIAEPALANEPNGIDLRVTDTTTNQPVDGAANSLKVTLTQGSSTKDLPLRARFGVPGGYTADVIPTKAGQYLFHFAGEINGDTIDEKFESGPGRFNDVDDPARIEFPVTSTAPAANTNSDQVATIARQVAAQDQALRDALDAAQTARTIGYAGILIGITGLAVAGLSLTRSRQSAPAPEPRAADSRA
jgi:hypothetical protein